MSDAMLPESLVEQYILGELSDSEAAAIEEQCFGDANQFTLMGAVEDELIAKYVRGKLTPQQKLDFERNFLISAERRQAVELEYMMALAGRQEPLPARLPEAGSPIREIRRSERLPKQFHAKWAAIAAAVLVAVGLELLLLQDWMKEREVLREVAGLMKPTIDVPESRGPAENPETLDVRASESSTHMNLDASSAPDSLFRIELQRDGRVLWRGNDLSTTSFQGEPVIPANLPNSLLRDGETYLVSWAPIVDLSKISFAHYRVRRVR